MTGSKIRVADKGRVLRAVMCAIAAAFLIGAIAAPDRGEMLTGLVRICKAPAQLTRDFFKPELGSISGAMLNGFLIAAVYCALMFLPGAAIGGGTVQAFVLTLGFFSYGMTILNILPIIFGVFVYSRLRREPFVKYLNMSMFATGLAPLVTQMVFYYPAADIAPHVTVLGVALALVIGVIVGCTMPILCAHAPGLHKGYDLFNAGPAAGLLCFFIYSVLYKIAGVNAPALGAELGEAHPGFVNAFCIAVFALLIVCGALMNGGFSGYGALLKDKGHKVDFTAKYPVGACIINLGVCGLFNVLVYNLIGASMNGVTMGAIFCMASCACVGLTPLNFLPVAVGYIAMGLLGSAGVTSLAVNAQGVVVGLCFATGLAPVAGTFGIIPGGIAGIMQYILVTCVPAIHGGFCLYNGGFTAGIVCFQLVPVMESVCKNKA